MSTTGESAPAVSQPIFRKRNLPNLLTFGRILLVPFLVVILLTKFDGKEFVGLAVFLVAAATDFLDGYLARRWNIITRLGKLLDPAADKILTSAAFISLVEMGVAPAWMVVGIVAREFAVGALRAVAAAENYLISASILGKVKTVTQIVAISLLIIYEILGSLQLLATVVLWVALVVTLISGIEYFFRYRKFLLND